MARKGDPRCPYCHGAGGERYNNRWTTCLCVNGTAEQRSAVRSLHSVGATRDPNKPLVERDESGQTQLDI